MGACPPPLDVQPARPTTIPVAAPAIPRSSSGSCPVIRPTLCVWVLATDPQGATAVDAMLVSSQDRAPIAVITVLEPTTTTSGGLFELYSIFHLSAATSTRSRRRHGRDAAVRSSSLAADDQAHARARALSSARRRATFLAVPRRGRRSRALHDLAHRERRLMRSDAATTKTLTVDDDHPACVSETEPAHGREPHRPRSGRGEDASRSRGILDDGAPLPMPAEGAHTRAELRVEGAAQRGRVAADRRLRRRQRVHAAREHLRDGRRRRRERHDLRRRRHAPAARLRSALPRGLPAVGAVDGGVPMKRARGARRPRRRVASRSRPARASGGRRRHDGAAGSGTGAAGIDGRGGHGRPARRARSTSCPSRPPRSTASRPARRR